jgi:hypothetical protein
MIRLFFNNLKLASFSPRLIKLKSINNNYSCSSYFFNNQTKFIKDKQGTHFMKDFDCIYEFRYIKIIKFITRAKIYQTGASIFFGMSSLLLFDLNMIDFNGLMTINGSMIFALIMLYYISKETTRVVGRMYLSKDKTRIMISHLNFFGKRQNLELPVEDIEPASCIEEINEKIFNLKVNNLEGSLLLSFPYANINKAAVLKLLKIKAE